MRTQTIAYRILIVSLTLLIVSVTGTGHLNAKQTSASARAVPQGSAIITDQNVLDMTLLAGLGRGTPYQVRSSPDARWLAVASAIGVWLYDMKANDEPRLLGRKARCSGVAFSPDSRTLAAAGDDGVVRLWDLPSGQSKGMLRGIDGETVQQIVFDSTGTKLFGSSFDSRAVLVWYLPALAQVTKLDGDSPLTSVAYNEDSGTIAASAADGTIRIWNANTFQLNITFKAHEQRINALASSHHGKWYASGGEDRIVHLWDADTGQQVRAFTDHYSAVKDIAFSPDDKVLATAEQDGFNILWNLQTGELTTAYLNDVIQPMQSVAVDINGYLIALSLEVRQWQVETITLIRQMDGFTHNVWGVAFSPDDRNLIAGSDPIQIWDLDKGGVATSLRGIAHTMAVSLFGENIGLAGPSYIRLFSLTKGLSDDILVGGRLPWKIVLNLDGSLLASASSDNYIYLWNVNTRTKIGVLQVPTSNTTSLAFSPDSKLLVSGGPDNRVRLWDLNTLSQLDMMSNHENQVNSVAFSPDGKLVASGSSDQSVIVWSIASGNRIIIRDANAAITAVTFSLDSQMVVTAGTDYKIKLWDAKTGGLYKTLIGHTAQVNAITFSHDGRLLASAGQDGMVFLWGIP